MVRYHVRWGHRRQIAREPRHRLGVGGVGVVLRAVLVIRSNKERWTDDGFEASVENGFLFFNVSKLLIFNDKLSLPWRADSHRV